MSRRCFNRVHAGFLTLNMVVQVFAEELKWLNGSDCPIFNEHINAYQFTKTSYNLHNDVAVSGGHHGGHDTCHGFLQPPPNLLLVAAAVLQVVRMPYSRHMSETIAPPRAVLVPDDEEDEWKMHGRGGESKIFPKTSHPLRMYCLKIRTSDVPCTHQFKCSGSSRIKTSVEASGKHAIKFRASELGPSPSPYIAAAT